MSTGGASGATVTVTLLVTGDGASAQAMPALLLMSVPLARPALTVAWKETEPLAPAFSVPRFQVSVPALMLPPPVALLGT